MRNLLAVLLASALGIGPARADQILGPGRIDTSNRVVLPGGPTLGTWQGGKYVATPNAMRVLRGMATSPSSSDGGLVYQNTDATDAATVLGPQQPPSYFTVDGIRSTVVNLPDSTAQTTSAFGFYVRNNSATKDATGIFGTSVCAVNGCSVWGLNPTVIDAPANGTVTSGTGRKLIGAEFDINVTSPNTTVVGISLLGSSISQPISADGFVVGDLFAATPGVRKWSHAYVVGDGTSQIGYLTGALSLSGSSVPGIPNFLNFRDSAGAPRALVYQVSGTGALNVYGTAAPNGIAFQPSAAGGFPSLVAYGSDTNIGLFLRAQGTGQLIAQNLVSANAGLYVDTSVQFAVPARLRAYTVVTLPTCNGAIKDGMAVVVDASAPTYRGAVTGGGAVRTPVYCDGTAWTAH